jgi:hypothetical protein
LNKYPLLIVKSEGVFMCTTDGEQWQKLERFCDIYKAQNPKRFPA